MATSTAIRPGSVYPAPEGAGDAAHAAHEARKRRLAEQLRAAGGASPPRLGKATSNLFRERVEGKAAAKLDVRDFHHVLAVDPERRLVDVEGMTTYEALVDTTLAHGLLPAVVPELKSITIGGAVSGLGIEATSSRYGLAHETVEELEVLLPDGRVVVCTPDNAHADLFFGFPNSFGTLGYALRVKARLIPAKPFVRVERSRHADPDSFFREIEARCRLDDTDADFVEGVVFGREEMHVSVGRFVDKAPYISDYTFESIYYKSIPERAEDYLTTRDYIWRWDTDWFWCSRVLLAENPIVRRLLLGRRRLNSTTYMSILRWNRRWRLMATLNRLRGLHVESVIQDVPIPIAHAPEFLDFFHREIGILPVWICPLRAHDPARRPFDLFRMDPNTLYVNFGFWDVVSSRERHPPGHYNRKIERKVAELGGLKSLYSDAYYDPDEFWRLYNKPAYDALKQKYDPERRLKDLYQKCVLRE